MADYADVYVQSGVTAKRVTTGASMLSAFKVQLRVIGALTLRDLRTRFGGSYISYSIAVLWPLTHLAILLGVYTFIGRQPSYGTDLFTWVLSGTLPFVIFMYSTRQVALSILAGSSLLSFSIVRRIDLLIARAAVELVTAVIIGTVMFSIFAMVHGPLGFAHFETCVLAVLAAYWGGVSFGTLAAPIVRLWPMFAVGIHLFVILCWVSSGVVYLPDSVPEPYHTYLSFNPLVHCAELLRYGLYPDYHSRTMDFGYFATLTSIVMLAGLLLERAMPKLATWSN